jgi:cytochrome c
MDFLKYIAFPQSMEHIALLHLVLNLICMLFLPYAGVLFGASVLSRYFERTGRRTHDPVAARFAKELTETVIANKSTLLFFGVLPFLSLLFAYAQLLQHTDNVAVSMIFFAFVLFTAATALLYTYRYTFRLEEIISIASSASKTEDLDEYLATTSRLHDRAGFWGVVLLSISLTLLIAGAAAASSPSSVTTLADALFSFESAAGILQSVAASGMVTGAVILYFFFAGKNSEDTPYALFVKKFAVSLTMASTMLLPLFVLASLAALPAAALTGTVFGLSALIVVLLLFIGHFLYALLQHFTARTAANAFFLLILVFGVAIVKDQLAFGNATQKETAVLSAQYDADHAGLLARFGLGAKPLTGEEIYAGRCSACHNFGDKKIGPAYKDVLPKYENNRDILRAFILNPRKMNPAFPPMPNQGLKPAEADSIAAYIMLTYKRK